MFTKFQIEYHILWHLTISVTNKTNIVYPSMVVFLKHVVFEILPRAHDSLYAILNIELEFF